MKKRISFLIVDHTRSSYRRISTSRFQLSALLLVAVAAAMAVTLATYDYVRLRRAVPYTRSLERKIEAVVRREPASIRVGIQHPRIAGHFEDID